MREVVTVRKLKEFLDNVSEEDLDRTVCIEAYTIGYESGEEEDVGGNAIRVEWAYNWADNKYLNIISD